MCVFLQLAKRYHPDHNKGDTAANKFTEIGEAYEVHCTTLRLPPCSVLARGIAHSMQRNNDILTAQYIVIVWLF